MLSIITPLHHVGNQFIEQTHDALKKQSETDWEWLICPNNGGIVPDSVKSDARVRVVPHPDEFVVGIGSLKRHLSMAASRERIVELDADDLLSPDALSEVNAAYEASGADFVYSDFAEFKDDWIPKWDRYPYGARYGWKTYPVEFDGHSLIAMKAPPVSPQNIRLVDWSPNHVRSWTKSAYLEVGGHDASMPVADDHDLIVRFYLAGKKFFHIPKCLYFYRVYGSNTVSTKNAEIRKFTNDVYNRSVWKLAEKFSDDNGLMKVDLCGGIDGVRGYAQLDLSSGHDLEDRWRLPDSSVGVLRAHDAVEHLKDPVHTMNEAWRVLAPGGFFMIHVPSTNGLGAFCDPTHKSFWNKLSFRYYTSAQFARYIPHFKGKFQVSRVIEWFPTEWHKRENVPYVEAQLIALKDGYEPMGEVLW